MNKPQKGFRHHLRNNYLGVILHPKLNWIRHLHKIKNATTEKLGAEIRHDVLVIHNGD